MMHDLLKRLGLLLLCCIAAWPAIAQQEQVWAFGYGAGLDFSSGTPVAINTAIEAPEGCATICNASGSLLFYTSGTDVWNANNTIMPNGANLQPDGAGTISQGALIVPVPDSAAKYYVFSLTNNHRLFYSVVDMDLNGGLGDVVAGRKGILVDTGFTEQMTAVAGNDCNIWVLVVTQLGMLKAFEVNYSGVAATPVQSPVVQVSGWTYEGIVGCMAVSPNRQRLSIARNNSLSLYDFDPQTGTCSNRLVLDTLTINNYATCFSPDNSKVYFTNFLQGLWQYDLSQPTPALVLASKFTLSWFGFLGLKLGADNKIYAVNRFGGFGNYVIDIIHAPNQPGPLSMMNTGVTGMSGLNNGLPNVLPPFIQRGAVYNSTTVAGGCAAIDITLQANPAGTQILWDNGQAGPARHVSATGTYWVSYQTSCAKHTDTFHVIHGFAGVNFPEIKIRAACKGDSNGRARVQRLNGDNTIYTFTWSDNLHNPLSFTDSLVHVTAGNYFLHINAGPGCDTTLPVIIPEEEHHAGFQADTLSCTGDAVLFNNTSPAHFNTFFWAFGDSTTTSLPAPAHTYTGSGTFRVMLAAAGPVCKDTVYASLIIDPKVSNLAFLKDKTRLCMGESVSFVPQLSDSTTVTGIRWDMGEGSTFQLLHKQPFSYAFDKPGLVYLSMVADFRACPSVSFSDSLYVYPYPVVSLGKDTVLCYQGAPVYLANLEPRPEGSRYAWSTGDTGLQLKVVHPGQYSLSVTSKEGCMTREDIVVRKDCYIDIPNAFTPDDDGYNDYFFPRQLLSRSLKRFRMQVFNRWGQLIFETQQTSGRGWDGRFNGVVQPGGVYLYRVDIELDNMRTEQYNGNVTLIR